MERKLKAHSQGFVLPEEAEPVNATLPRIPDVIEAYLVEIAKPDQDNHSRSQRSINSRRFELKAFAKFCGKVYVEGIDTRKDLIAYRDYLYSRNYQRNTVLNKMMCVVTWLKHNPVYNPPILLKKADWPTKKKTQPDPYEDGEVAAMLSFATPDESLLIC
jgi:hypothetical protein